MHLFSWNNRFFRFSLIALLLVGGLSLSLGFKASETDDSNKIKRDSVQQDSLKRNKFYKTNVHASYYHDKFNGRKTASGQLFDNKLYTAAHRTLKFGTKVKVINPDTDKSVIVVINDRGPFVSGREIDLTKKAFSEIADSKRAGFLIVNLEIIE
ncbi:septal ring lytic transglycosylase RlpA family protein [Flavobacterium sp. NRK F10]|nr:septal ring lytic transglycosylase RlpA family protein [Flavobacterium sp. NRK F10]MCO6174617.1 septal ring lytic transglycosylase RlpA family protein [Flavobacterium sp. NRK F10]